MSRTANIIVTHQTPDAVARMLAWWRDVVPEESIWIAYGGLRENFERLEVPRKFFLESTRIRTSHPQRDRQGYHEVFQKAVAAGVLSGRGFVHLAEFDQIPLQPVLNDLQVARMKAEQADVLGYRLARLDGTSHPHWLHHAHDGRLQKFLAGLSVRREKDVILSMLGFGSFWTAEAFAAMAKVDEPFPIYLEIFMPSVAHHLGFRVRRIAEPEKYNDFVGDASRLEAEARAAGIWNLHPVKGRWNATTT